MAELIFDTRAERLRAMLSGKGQRYFVRTFGCQQNEADSERIAGVLEYLGYLPADSEQDADIIIVNTCAIREHAEMKVYSLLGTYKAIKQKNPELLVGVVGCMAAEAHNIERLKRDFHFVTFTLEPGEFHKIPSLIYERLVSGRRSFIPPLENHEIHEGIPAVRRSDFRAWVSIMYGCNNFCSYCVVPYVRGRERSRRSEDILAECRTLVCSGVKEITLLGQNVNSYKSDISFAALLSRIAEIPGDFTVTFMTAHPKDTTDELISVMARYRGKISPYFHLPLQSGSNKILRLMNRTYTRESFMETAMKLRSSIPNISISTDVIVGFPGEGDEDYLDTLDVLSRVRFDLVFGFIYSKRRGTKAAEMDGQVPEDVKSERLHSLLKMQDGISYGRNEAFLGKTLRVLATDVEGDSVAGLYRGRAENQKTVHFIGKDITVGEFYDVKINKIQAFDLFGEAIKEK